MRALDAPALRLRYLTLLGLRWFPTGLLLPVTTLLAVERGLSLAEIGLAMSVQGLVVVALELPTGGLADSWGRRPVLVLAAVAGLGSLAVLAIADSPAMFALAWALQGIFRALDSGPLESWYVDAALAVEPHVRLDRALGMGGTVIGIVLGAGALVSGALVAWVALPSLPALLLPVLVALAVQLVGSVALLLLPPESRQRRSRWEPVFEMPAVIVAGVRTVCRSRPLAALAVIQLAWGFGIVAVETLLPVRIAELAGGTTAAAEIMGPAVAGAWLLSAAGAAAAPLLASRIGIIGAAVTLRALHGATIVAMGLLAGPVGALAGFGLAYLTQGAVNPLYASLLHRHVPASVRTTTLSITSMAGQCRWALGLITLSAVADAVSTMTAIVLGGIVLAATAPLYLMSRVGR